MTSKWIAIGLTLLASLARTAAASTILEVDAYGGGNQFTVTDTGSSNTVTMSSASVLFFFDVPNAIGDTPYLGTMTLSASTSDPVSVQTSGTVTDYVQGGWSSTATATLTCTSCTGAYADAVVFSFTFGPSGESSMSAGGSSGTLHDSQPPQTEVAFSSPLIDFSTYTLQSFGFALSDASPWTVNSDGYLADNTASEVITFSATDGPATPEPGTAILLGCALAGLFYRQTYAIFREHRTK